MSSRTTTRSQLRRMAQRAGTVKVPRHREVEPAPLSDKQMQIRMPIKLYEKLRYCAFTEHRSLGAIARILIEEGLKGRAQA